MPEFTIPGYRPLDNREVTKLNKQSKRAWKKVDPNLRAFVDKRVGWIWEPLKLAALAMSIHLNHYIEAAARRALAERLAAQNAGTDASPATTIREVPPFHVSPAVRPVEEPRPVAPASPAARAPIVPQAVRLNGRVEPTADQVRALGEVFRVGG